MQASKLSAASLAALSKPEGRAFDVVLASERPFGHGAFYDPSGRFIQLIGNGQQLLAWDPVKDLIVVILRNGLHPGDEGRSQMDAIVREAFRIALSS